MNATVERKVPQSKLFELKYRDSARDIYLTVYADTIVFDDSKNTKLLAAVRFGGYPEQVRGMADAIYGGATVYTSIGDDRLILASAVKQYRREFTHDGNYAVATLMIEDEKIEKDDDEQTEDESKKNGPRTSYLFCERDNAEQLFEQLDRKVSVPLIPDFREYFISELETQKALIKLTVLSHREKFDAWKLIMTSNERNIINIVNKGLTNGQIAIPGSAVAGTDPFTQINSVTQYLNAYAITIAERIRNQFNPLFDPKQEKISGALMDVNKYIRKKAGYNLFDAQLCTAEAMVRCLKKHKVALCVAECGSGKTKIGSATLGALQAMHGHQNGKGIGKRKHFNIVLCPSHMTRKWVREIEETLC